MNINQFFIIDNFLDDPELHLQDIFNHDFTDVPSDVGTFKNIQDRQSDIVSNAVINLMPNYDVAYNFVRKSPLDQEEPTYIHSDDIMGDITCLLYLSKNHPKEDGTTIYENDELTKSIEFRSKFNRMIIFDAKLFHSRNILSNFGVNKSARLIQVIFLKKK
jgi:hypothetical protein